MRLLLLVLFVSLNSQAVTPPKKSTETTPSTNKTGTSKSHNFEDLLVDGKYHFADEAVSTVEADKVFDSLIGVRNDFKDRLEDSASNK